MSDANLSGMTDNTLADVTAALDDLDLVLAGAGDEDILDAIEELAPDEVIETSIEASASDEDVIDAIETEIAAVEETVVQTEASADPAPNTLDDLDLGDLTDEALAEIEAHAARQEIYEAQESEIDSTLEATATPAGKAPKAAAAPKEKKERKASTATPRAPKDIALIDPALFVLESDASPADQAAAEQLRADVIALRPKQVKIAEKFDNLFGALATNKAPSVYVMSAFAALDEKSSMTSTEIAGVYKAQGHKDGTANSQSGQMMVLFDTLKVATRTKNTLTINPKSAIAAKLRSIVAAKAAGA